MKFFFLFFLFLPFSNAIYSQKNDYSFLNITDSLKQDANSVVRLNQIDISILSQRNMKVLTKRAITILNEKGLSSIDAIEYYDKKTNVDKIQATVYNLFGTEIKKFKKKDFRDQCVTNDGTIFSDSRVVYLDFTPTDYPFTLVFESEISTSNTAFIKPFVPVSNYYSGVEKSVFTITFPENLGFKYKECNFSGYQIIKNVNSKTQLSYTASNIVAQKTEDLSLNFREINPIVFFSLEFFNLEGIDGNAKNWKEYGKWFSSKILDGTTELSDATKTSIIKLVGNETDIVKKAKIVYKFVQEKSRYISIQVGIGGFKPMNAKDVDRLGYGDCKALSNYTRALLSVVEVPSYYTELFAGNDKIGLQNDFFSIQGNHVILCIPDKEKNIFLECTSQDNPFGYQGNFTDDRDVLIIKPDGGEIVRTAVYDNKTNSQISKGKFDLYENGSFSGTIEMATQGVQYARSSKMENNTVVENEKHYKQYWNNINNLEINKISFLNDKEKVEFVEKLIVSAENFGKVVGNNIIFSVNAFNQYNVNLKKKKNRKTAFEIARGFFDVDEIEINLPSAFSIESLPIDFDLISKFGEYKTTITKISESKLIYKRSFFLKKGVYKNTEFEEYRMFLEQITRNDNAKIVLLKKT